MDPLLVITNATPAPPTRSRWSCALAILREHASVEVQATSNPGELDGVLHRAGSRRIVVAGGDGSLHAVIAALHRRNDLKNAVHRRCCRSAPATTSRAAPASPSTSRRRPA